jgi:outer membrane protein OmpA-like peptidoglycan-associated protein
MYSYRKTAVFSPSALAMAVSGGPGQVDEESYIYEPRAEERRPPPLPDSVSPRLRQRFAAYGATVTCARGLVRIDTLSHFACNEAVLGDDDKALLQDFADAVAAEFSEAQVIVEGFADAAGNSGYNHRLSLERAGAIRDYLVNACGLLAERVHAAGHAETAERHAAKSQWNPGAEPGHVALIMDLSIAPAGL